MTNNGQLAHVLLSPKRHVQETSKSGQGGYDPREDEETFIKSSAHKDYLCQPARLEILSTDAEESQRNPCDHCKEGVSSDQARMGLLCEKSGGLATILTGNFSIR